MLFVINVERQYRYWSDPLRPVPGPFLAKYTGAWIVLVELAGHKTTTIHKLHKKYGPVVRIAPKQLSFNSTEALNKIYGTNSKYQKGHLYDSLGFRSTFTTRNRDEYRVMKKRITPSFSPAAIAEMEPLVRQQVASLLKCFDKRLETPIDVLPWFRMMALGVIGKSPLFNSQVTN